MPIYMQLKFQLHYKINFSNTHNDFTITIISVEFMNSLVFILLTTMLTTIPTLHTKFFKTFKPLLKVPTSTPYPLLAQFQHFYLNHGEYFHFQFMHKPKAKRGTRPIHNGF